MGYGVGGCLYRTIVCRPDKKRRETYSTGIEGLVKMGVGKVYKDHDGYKGLQMACGVLAWVVTYDHDYDGGEDDLAAKYTRLARQCRALGGAIIRDAELRNSPAELSPRVGGAGTCASLCPWRA